MKRQSLVIICILFECVLAKAQEKANANFYDSWKKTGVYSYFYTDESQIVNGIHPLKVTSKKVAEARSGANVIADDTAKKHLKKPKTTLTEAFRKKDKIPFSFEIAKDTVLPNSYTGKINITLKSYCHLLDQVHLCALAYDSDKKVVYSDSLNINYMNEDIWAENMLIIRARDIKSISIRIVSRNMYMEKEQIFLADRIRLTYE